MKKTEVKSEDLINIVNYRKQTRRLSKCEDKCNEDSVNINKHIFKNNIYNKNNSKIYLPNIFVKKQLQMKKTDAKT